MLVSCLHYMHLFFMRIYVKTFLRVCVCWGGGAVFNKIDMFFKQY